jgi:hypothetical protein
MMVGGRTATVCRYPVRVDSLIRARACADSPGMEKVGIANELRERALLLAAELGVDPGSWYVRVLEEGRAEGHEADLGALVRIYWELQRVTGRADLRDTWRSLADRFWSGKAA